VSGVVPFELSVLRDLISEVEIRRQMSHIFFPYYCWLSLDVVCISDKNIVVVM
jgi:hypothetical protein